MPTNREIVEAYSSALTKDLDQLDALRHPDFVEDWPQSGERVRGPANMRAIDEHYPGNLTQGAALRIVGSEDRWVMTPSYSALRIEGTGDVYTCVWRAVYPDGHVWHVVSIIQLKDQRVWRATTFFAEAFESPAWRAAWVERMPSGE
jgi:hypothetical protein